MGQNRIFIDLTKEEFIEIIRDCVKSEIKCIANPNQEEIIKANEVCKMLQISSVTLHKWVKDGKLQGYYLSSRLYFKRTEVLQALSTKN